MAPAHTPCHPKAVDIARKEKMVGAVSSVCQQEDLLGEDLLFPGERDGVSRGHDLPAISVLLLTMIMMLTMTKTMSTLLEISFCK